MERCDFIKPLLYRIVEGEASPDEAMRVARHLPACTVCRIRLARERRLAQMLEEDLNDLPVGEEFVQSVMATLPEEPSKAEAEAARAKREAEADAAKRRRRRGLKLAGLAGLLGSWSWVASQDYGFNGGGSLLQTPALSLESLEGSYRGLPAVAQMIWMAIGALVEGLPRVLPAFPELSLVALGLGLVLLALVGTLGTSTFLFCAAGYLARPSLGWLDAAPSLESLKKNRSA